MAEKRIGIVTGGGDCPGLNAAIRAITKSALRHKIHVYGVEEGFLGLHQNRIRRLEYNHVSGILPLGGTILRTSRFNPLKQKAITKACVENFANHRLEGLIVIGGDGSLGIALDLSLHHGIPVIGIPKTIDNDVYGTERTIGFYTAVQTAMEAIDRLHTTAESHNFVMVIELMGRHCGYLAAHAGMAGGADFILVPEVKVTADQLVTSIKERHMRGKNFSIVVVSEDAKLYDGKGKLVVSTPSLKDEYGKIKLGGVGEKIVEVLKKSLPDEIRYVNLGHVQRGGSPVASDRLLATAFGCAAVELVMKNSWEKLLACDGDTVIVKPLSVIRKGTKKLPGEFYKMAECFF